MAGQLIPTAVQAVKLAGLGFCKFGSWNSRTESVLAQLAIPFDMEHIAVFVANLRNVLGVRSVEYAPEEALQGAVTFALEQRGRFVLSFDGETIGLARAAGDVRVLEQEFDHVQALVRLALNSVSVLFEAGRQALYLGRLKLSPSVLGQVRAFRQAFKNEFVRNGHGIWGRAPDGRAASRSISSSRKGARSESTAFGVMLMGG